MQLITSSSYRLRDVSGDAAWRMAAPTSKPHQTLEKIGLFRSLDVKERVAFERRCGWRQAQAKEWLFEQDDVGNDIYFLTRGVARVLITSSHGCDVLLGDVEAGGYFGEMAAIDSQPRSAGILAMTDATIASMPAVVFREFLRSYPDASQTLLKHLVTCIRTLDQRVEDFSSMCVEDRIITELLRRSRPNPVNNRQAIVSPPPVHSDIAARVSTGREMVTRKLKLLERAGLLAKRRGAFVITNVPELMEKLQGDAGGRVPRLDGSVLRADQQNLASIASLALMPRQPFANA